MKIYNFIMFFIKAILICLVAIVVICVGIFVYLEIDKYNTDNAIKISVSNSISGTDSNKVIYNAEKYYYIDNGSLYTFSDVNDEKVKVLDIGDNTLITKVANGFCVANNTQLTYYDNNLKKIVDTHIEEPIQYMSNIGGLLYIQDYIGMRCYDYNNNLEEIDLKKPLYDDTYIKSDFGSDLSKYQFVYKDDFTVVYSERNDLTLFPVCIINSDATVNYFRSGDIFYKLSDDSIFYAQSDTIFGTINIKNNLIKSFSISDSYHNFNQCKILNDKYITVLQKVKKPQGISDNLHLHESDCVRVIDPYEQKCVNEFKTEKGERILYADLSNAVTYNNKSKSIIKYNVNDNSVISSFKYDKLKDGRSYCFHNCNGKIFVYDGDCVIDIININ